MPATQRQLSALTAASPARAGLRAFAATVLKTATKSTSAKAGTA